ncbi:RNA polymerase sigma factor [Hydrogenophaga sp.]|uniref:RNA polymerase sigma factor n=1 Tax=Hydrogenophaga sp. TaxID=1904254 RepID=UPI003AF5FBE1
MNTPAAEAAALTARDAYGRLVAYLAWRWSDLAAAEDALGDALLKALERWPLDGVPAQPEGWLLTVARRELLQSARHRGVVQRLADDPLVRELLPREDDTAPEPFLQANPIPDNRLRLMLVCAHPAIDRSVRTPLMLQAVLGLDAQRMAAAFLVSPSAMAQRLVRAKQKIAQAGIRFEEPDPSDLPQRTHAVLEAVYAAYGLAWERLGAAGDDAAMGTELAAEALYLAELCVALLPHDAEARGLWALMLFCESRRRARFEAAADGSERFVPLHEQDTARWDHAQIARANSLLREAAALGQLGPYQLEAAIQSAHAQRAITGRVPWGGIAQLYNGLLQIAPTVGAQIGHAVALGTAHGAEHGLAALDALPEADVRNHAPWWVARAHLLEQQRQWVEAAEALRHGMGLTVDPRLRAHLWLKLQALQAAPVTDTAA